MKLESKKTSYAGIKGVSVVNHRIRVKLDLTCNEYMIADFLYKMMKAKAPFLYHDKYTELLWKVLGIRLSSALTNFATLEQKGIVFKDNKDHVIPTDIWIDEFEKPLEKEFEQFWEFVYGRHGSKAEALTKFIEVRKTVSYDHLLRRHQVYQKHLDQNDWKQKMHMSVWLNPKKKKWDDHYPVLRENDTGFRM